VTDRPVLSILREISRHPGATVAEGVFEGRRAAIKTFSSYNGFRRESGALAAMARAGAPVAHPMWAGAYGDRHVLIQSWVDGTPGLDAFRAARGADRAELVELAAATHAHLCRAALDGPGLGQHVVEALTGSRADAWPQILAAQVGKWLSRVSLESLSLLGGGERLARLLEAARAAPAEPHTIVHCDYLFRNLIIGSPKAAVVIDFGAALMGDPRYDLAKLVWCDLDGSEGELAGRFITAWVERTGLAAAPELINLYVCCHSLAAVAWVDKQSSPTLADSDFRRRALQTFAATPKHWL
jgi:aminoglycoside phosphotransferase (APT) family kinase protein